MCGPMNDSAAPAPPASPDARLRELRRALDGVCSRDFGRLLGRWRGLSRQPDGANLDALAASIEASVAKRQARVAAKPAVKLDEC